MDRLFFDDITTQVEIPMGGITSRTLHSDEHARVVLFGFDAGQELSEHTASMPAILHVLRGEASLTLGGETHAVSGGAWAYMPAHLPHGIAARTPLVMLLTLVKAAKDLDGTAAQ